MITALIDIVDKRNADDRENLGLASIASYLQHEGYNTSLYSFEMDDPLCEAGIPLPLHDLFGFSLYPNTAGEVYRYAKWLKRIYPRSWICVGGKLASAVPSLILKDCKEIDFVVTGYGEIPMLQAVKHINNNLPLEGIPSIYYRSQKGEPDPITIAPQVEEGFWPRRDFLPMSFQHGNFTARINGSFGCYGGCTFCAVNQYKCVDRKRWIGRGAEDLFHEMVHLNQVYNVETFYFNDASFEDPPGGAGKARIEKLCRLLLESPYRFAIRCSMRSESFKAQDGALLELMRRSGFTQVFLGIEAGDDRDLKVFHKRARTADHEEAIRIFQSKGIDIIMGFIMLNPYSTLDTMLENFRFLQKHFEYRLDPFIRKIDIYAGTLLEKKLQKDQLLTENFDYRSPLEYGFVHGETARFDTFLEGIRQDGALGSYDGKLYHLTCVMNNLRALFGEAADEYFFRFAGLRQQLSALVTSFFAIVYVQRDLALAAGRFAAFKETLLGMSMEVDSFILRLMHDRKFRAYFLKEIDQTQANASNSEQKEFHV